MMNLIITLFILSLIYVLFWYTVKTEKENKPPVFSRDDTQESIYVPKKDSFDKLSYRDHDLRKNDFSKFIRKERERRERYLSAFVKPANVKTSTIEFSINNFLKSKNSIPESSPIPRHPQVYDEWAIQQALYPDSEIKTRIIKLRTPRS